MPSPNVFAAGVSGLPLSGTDYNNNWNLAETSFLDLGPYVISGLVPSIGTGLSVNVTSGAALLGANIAVANTFAIGGLTPSSTCFLYLQQNGTGTSNTTGTAPANSVLLGTCVTGVATVTSVNTARSSGRQLWVAPQSRVPGAVGGPGSINLASWAAAAADGIQVFGTLPPGAAGMPGEAAFSSPPAAASLTPLNVTTATLIDSSAGGLFLSAPSIGVLHGQFWLKSLAAGAYTWTARLAPVLINGSDCQAGLALRDSVSGKLLSFEFQSTGGAIVLKVVQWTDASSRSASALGLTINGFFPWLKIHDDGTTNRTYSVSMEGVNWVDVLTEARTTFLGVAPNQAGIFATAEGEPVALTVFSWSGA